MDREQRINRFQFDYNEVLHEKIDSIAVLEFDFLRQDRNRFLLP